ncbi:nitroreductase family protein [Jannaschia sp. LMIT008]|uniref:nitroreductase family protein n=1 Tax=Jannaschia maritima TaxID=3032585 RepID=UPI002810B5C0|nr:nitroreductase family protein [Jannaschia sp. LMIT008]
MSQANALRPRPEVTDFLSTRRSRPARSLTAPAPDRDALTTMLTLAVRVPDHKKLEPWRFVVAEGAALSRLADAAQARMTSLGASEKDTGKAASLFRDAPVVVCIVASPVADAPIPEVEQTLSAGAVCLGLLNAAAAGGFGANWLSGTLALDRPFLEDVLGLSEREWVAGFVVLGTETAVPPDRPRPDVAALTTWIDA